MARVLIAKNRNVIVGISDRILCKFAIMTKHKDELNPTELLELKDFMKAMKVIPIDVAKYIYLKYLKIPVVEERLGFVPRNRKINKISQKYKCRAPSMKTMAEKLNKPIAELIRLEETGFQELADVMLKYQLNRMDLYEYEVCKKSVYDVSLDNAKASFEKMINDMTFERYEIEEKKAFKDVDFFEYTIHFFKTEWCLKDDKRRQSYKEGTFGIRPIYHGYKRKIPVFQSNI